MFTIMKRRIRKLSGLQETFVELDTGKDFIPPKKAENSPIIQNNETVYEVFIMNDSSPPSTHNSRAIGVDIGTGFISCAEREGDDVIFS